MGCIAPVYRPRDAEHTVLHQVVAEHLEAFLGAVAEAGDGAGLPQFVEREFREWVRCGVFMQGRSRVPITQVPTPPASPGASRSPREGGLQLASGHFTARAESGGVHGVDAGDVVLTGARSEWGRDPGKSEEQRESPEGEQDADGGGKPTAPRHGLLQKHHSGKDEHPAEIDSTRSEHQQHQSPAATDAEDPVVDAEHEGVDLAPAAAPMLDDEADWRTAALEARVLERRKLKEPGGQ